MDECIRTYFERGYTYLELIALLKFNIGIDISYRQLKRHLRRLGLKRRSTWNVEHIQVAVQSELDGSGRNLGCRSMAQRLRSRHGMSIGRNTVLQQLRVLDPDGIEARRRHRLTRRIYRNKGPNFLIHADGYDKIKRYGLAIHGAIDGYSRRVLWLRVNRSNNDPKVVASYFLDFVTEIKGAPRCVRMDAGTENGTIAYMQKSFRWFDEDDMAGDRSVIIGSSHSNQRIECWWRKLHEMCISAWQDIFSDLESRGLFSTANSFHIECVRFCFTQIIQNELDLVRQEWNDHQIRRQSREEVHGKPELLYHYPQLSGTRNYKFPVEMGDVATFRSFSKTPTATGCEEPLQCTLIQLLESTGRRLPETVEGGTDLLEWLINYFQ